MQHKILISDVVGGKKDGVTPKNNEGSEKGAKMSASMIEGVIRATLAVEDAITVISDGIASNNEKRFNVLIAP